MGPDGAADLTALTFEDLLGSFTVERFMSEFYQRKPILIPGTDGGRLARSVLDWRGFNRMLHLESHWSEQDLRLVMNGRPVLAEHYCQTIQTPKGPQVRASAAKVRLFASMGASIVADGVQHLSPEIAALADMLAHRFMALTEANIYCSFRNVQAFGAHYDLHEVFALQCEGEKTWRIYQNREDNPVNPPPFTDDARLELDRAKGPLMFEVQARPGDVLYIPRGWYHDAIATADASLHLTLSVTPLSGRALLPALEEIALRDSQFRAYLPDHREDGGAALASHLDDLSRRLAAIMLSKEFTHAVSVAQRKRAGGHTALTLPLVDTLQWFGGTGQSASVVRGRDGAILETGARRIGLGLLHEPAEWMLGRPAFSLQEAKARFPHFGVDELRVLVNGMLSAGCIRSIAPPQLS